MAGAYAARGYIAPFGAALDAKSDVGQNSDRSGRMAWLENYCRSHPLDDFGLAVANLWGSLMGKKSP